MRISRRFWETPGVSIYLASRLESIHVEIISVAKGVEIMSLRCFERVYLQTCCLDNARI